MLCDLISRKGLPWKNEYDEQIIMQMKEIAWSDIGSLFNGLECWKELSDIFNYIIRLKYSDDLDYLFISKQLIKCLKPLNVFTYF
ncbi:unnamed protein product [Caenorhabditis angaria]|uniref:Uncharacterized protein n=1 Tax=Caenorhabditis angaria TaxID=860376 RepID=A0A9P1N049_9PELO|nr:unnamed protein product [Caenorhabditis angaria]